MKRIEIYKWLIRGSCFVGMGMIFAYIGYSTLRDWEVWVILLLISVINVAQ